VIAPPDQIVDHSGFNMLNAELIEFARCIRDKQPYPVDIDDILHGMAVFDAAVQSAKTGRIVEIARS
jgi:predicted dehydrogenase